MLPRWAVGALVAGLLCVSVVSPEENAPGSVRPLMTLHGRSSKITTQRVLRVTTEAEWEALWAEHKLGSPAPKTLPRDFEHAELDFARVMVIAVFEGEGVGCGGYTAHSVTEGPDRLTVRLLAYAYQTGFAPGILVPPTQGWGLLVLLRSRKAVVLERDIRVLIRHPPKWEKWKTFPSLRGRSGP
jgi:hypothetical protein